MRSDPSGRRLASASYDRTARVWDVETGESLRTFEHTDPVTGVVYGTDEDHIATIGADRRAAIWNVTTGRTDRVFVGHTNVVLGVGYIAGESQPDAATAAGQESRSLLVTDGFDRTLRVWDTDTGVTLRVLQGHLAGVTRLAVRPHKESDAPLQVFSCSNDGTVRRWDIAPLPHQYLIDVPAEAWTAAIAPAGDRVAVGFGDGSLRLYTLPGGRLGGRKGGRTRLCYHSSRL